MSEAGEPTVAREQVCGPGVILTASVKGAREGARVKIIPTLPLHFSKSAV